MWSDRASQGACYMRPALKHSILACIGSVYLFSGPIMFPCSTVSAGNILVLRRNTVTEVTQMAGIELQFPCLH